MSGEERSPHEIWAALSRLTRRLDDLAGSLARLEATGASAGPSGEALDEARRARLGRLESLLAVGPHLGPEEARLLAVDRLIYSVGADCAAVFIAMPEGALEAVARRGLPGGLRVRPEDGIVGRAFRERETIRASHAHQAADPLLRDHGLMHAIAVPIRVPDQPVLGVLFAARRRPVAFGDEAIESMTLLADRVALAVEPRPVPTAPAMAAPGFTADLDLERTATAVAREAASRLGAARVGVILTDDGEVRLIGSTGLGTDAVLPDRRVAPIDAALRQGRVWAAAGEDGDDALARFLGTGSQLVVPLTVGDQIVAILVAGGPGPLAPAVLADVLPPAAVAIRNARLHTES
ncbi:MAG: GAF domain-containing protein, partial [Candidatus Rokuibacteriota bacterium]